MEEQKKVDIFTAIRPKLREYLEMKGIRIDSTGFFSCIHPNHPDVHPSCSIGGNTKEEVFHCFSGGHSGNIIHAVHYLDKKPITGLGLYQDTLPYIAKLFDIPYEPIEISEDQKREFQKRRAYEDAVNVICSMSYKKIDGKRVLNREHPAIKHLLDRGITEATIKNFQIGCIESFKDYQDEMKTLGWSDKSYLEAADLANKKIFSPAGIIIPIFDHKGRAVGFVTRRTDMAANDHGQEKYVNSQNSDIYHKSEVLFNFNNCAKDDGPLFIVEGYLDAVYLTQQGIPNVAAIGATMLTEEHVDMLFNQKFKNIIICLDADDGGRRGVKLAIERLASYKNFKVRIIELPDGYDPDSYVREFGKEKFLELSKSDVALSPFTWMLKWTTFEDDPMETAKKAIPTIAAEESNIVRLQMIRELSRLTGLDENDIRKDVDALVNKESSRFLEELSDINNFVQVQLSRKKTRDTKGILEEGLLKVKSLEKQYNNAVDNKSEYVSKLEEVRGRIESGEFKYGIRAMKFKKFYENFDGIPYTTCLSLVGGKPSAGKCLAPYTKVWMYDGTLKFAKDIKLNDLLMGDDSTPRRVLSTISGYDQMYDVHQANGITYRVNAPHILSLKKSRNSITKKHGAIIDIPVKDFIKKSEKFKSDYKGYKVPIEFKQQDVLIDPYFLGIWLGDGDQNSVTIYSVDKEVQDYLHSYAHSLGLQVTENRDGTCPSFSITKGKDYNARNFSLQQLLRVEEVLHQKHIPEKYIINSRENRLELLAGIIDSDGWYSAEKGYFEITQTREDLILQIKKLADTLGFRTNLAKRRTTSGVTKFEGEAYRLIVSGNVWEIPTKIKRKRAPVSTNKRDWTISQLTIQDVGTGEYVGFVIDGNRRFLLEDGTVTHNTMWMTSLAMDIIDTEEDAAIFYMSIDDTTELMTLKMLAMKSGLSTSEIKRYSELDEEKKAKVQLAWAWVEANADRFILADATAGNTIDALESHVDWFMKNFKTPKKLFLLDNFHKLRFPSGGARSKKTDIISDGSERIKEITQLNDLHIMATVELRKLEGSQSRPQLSDLKDSVQLEYDADIITLVHNDKQVKEDTYLIWQGPSKDGLIRAMPYIEINVWKNKITGQLRPIAYRLNDYNLRLEEVPESEVRALKEKKTNGENVIGRPRGI